jgi:hypothetical protein
MVSGVGIFSVELSGNGEMAISPYGIPFYGHFVAPHVVGNIAENSCRPELGVQGQSGDVLVERNH